MQLRMAEERGIEATAGQRPVERFMQTYFRHSSAIAEISRRFAAMHQPRSLAERLVSSVVTHRSNGIFRVGRGRAFLRVGRVGGGRPSREQPRDVGEVLVDLVVER